MVTLHQTIDHEVAEILLLKISKQFVTICIYSLRSGLTDIVISYTLDTTLVVAFINPYLFSIWLTDIVKVVVFVTHNRVP